MDLVDIFPVTIAVSTLESLNDDVIKKAIDLIEHGATIGDLESDGTYTREQQLLDKLLFRDVKAEILNSCLEYARAYSHQVNKLEICNSWGNIIGNSQSIRIHKHNNSYISGSFYLTEGSAFVLHNFYGENLFSMVPAITTGQEKYRGQQSFLIPPKPGRLILFPSGLYHSVQPSQGKEKRYSVAFNTMPVGRIGTPTNLVELGNH